MTIKGYIRKWRFDFISTANNGLTFNLAECELKKSTKGDLFARHPKSKIQFSLGDLIGFPGITWNMDEEVELAALPALELTVVNGSLAVSQGAVKKKRNG